MSFIEFFSLHCSEILLDPKLFSFLALLSLGSNMLTPSHTRDFTVSSKGKFLFLSHRPETITRPQ